jgi:hypothetical protein
MRVGKLTLPEAVRAAHDSAAERAFDFTQPCPWVADDSGNVSERLRAP